MSFPSLRSLRVDTLRWNYPEDVPQEVVDTMPCIIGCLARSSPPLKRLTLAAWEVAPSVLPTMLHHLGHLTILNLRVDLLSDLSFLPEFFDELAKNNDGTFAVVPHLKKLAIRLNADPSSPGYDKRGHIAEIDGKHFVSMVRERTSHSAPSLRNVKVTVDAESFCALVESDFDILKQCERRVKGLRVKIVDAGWE